MEQIINSDNLSQILSETNVDINEYQKLIETLYIDCIGFQIHNYNSDQQFDEFQNHFQNYQKIEQISLFLLSNYTNVLNNNFSEEIIQKSMNVVAIAFEKLGNYIGTINSGKISQTNIILKQLRYYFRSAVAYILAGNAPNCYVIAKNMKQVIINKNIRPENIDYIELMYFSISIFLRYFPKNIPQVIEPKLKQIIIYLNKLFLTGEGKYFDSSLIEIKSLKEDCKNNCSSFRYYMLFFLNEVIKKIWVNSVWELLKTEYYQEYIKTLICSSPPVFDIWPNQKKIILDRNSVLNNDNIKRSIINFSTSGGKSLIAELAIVKELMRRPEKICFYIVPSNALVHEVTKRFLLRFRRLNYNVKNVISGNENDSEMNRNDNVIVTTPEKLLTLIRTDFETSFFKSVSMIVFDEFHKIEDNSRGWTIESVIWFLISHNIYKNIKLLILSAIMDNGDTVLNWLDDGNNFSDSLHYDIWKPSQTLKAIAQEEFNWKNTIAKENPLYEKWKDDRYDLYYGECLLNYYRIVSNNIDFKYHNIPLFQHPKYRQKEKDTEGKKKFVDEMKKEKFATAVAQQLSKIGTTLILLNTKPECEKFVSNYVPYFRDIQAKEDSRLQYLSNYITKRLGGNNNILLNGIKHGIIYHYGSLSDDIREALEEAITHNIIRIIVSTTTLLEGVNFPIQNFIYYGKKYEDGYTINIADLKNIAGRAGRAYQTTYGQIIFIKDKTFPIDEDKYFEKEKLNFHNYKNNIQSSIKDDTDLIDLINKYYVSEENEKNDYFIKIIEKPFFQTLLLLFNSVIDNENNLPDLISKTLFSKNINDKNKKMICSFSQIVYQHYQTINKQELLAIQKSGLSITSYKMIKEIAKEVVQKINDDEFIICDFKKLFAKETFLKIIQIEEFNIYRVKRSTGNSNEINIQDYELLIDWCENKLPIPKLVELYFIDVKEHLRMNRMTEYIKDFYEFKLPWALNILFNIVINNFSSIENIQKDILKQYSTNVKYGLNNQYEVLLIQLGFNSRDTIIDLAKLIEGKNIKPEKDEIIKELVSMSHQDYLNFTEYEIRKINQVLKNLKKSTNLINEIGKIQFKIAGTKYYFCQLSNKKDIFNNMSSNDLLLKREKDNYFDENAIGIEYKEGNLLLGYIPKAYNEEIAYYIDLDYSYEITLENKKIFNINEYVEISISISFNL